MTYTRRNQNGSYTPMDEDGNAIELDGREVVRQTEADARRVALDYRYCRGAFRVEPVWWPAGGRKG